MWPGFFWDMREAGWSGTTETASAGQSSVHKQARRNSHGALLNVARCPPPRANVCVSSSASDVSVTV